MYKMKFINNKWNPTFARNTQSSCFFPLSLSESSWTRSGWYRELEKGDFEHGSQWAPCFGPPPFFLSKNTSFSFYSSRYRFKYLQPVPCFIPSCSKYLYHMGEQWEQESLKTQSISCSGCYILFLPEKEHYHSHHPLHLHLHLNKKQYLNSQSW